jgi:DNA polymerase III alpha subunit (gram-positive type)
MVSFTPESARYGRALTVEVFMAHTRAPRGKHATKRVWPIDELLPEKVRIQFNAYNPRTKQYHSLSAYNIKLIVRNQRELDRLFKLLDEAARNMPAWQD